ncbi:hypothetical protein [Aliivibrio salmonicida]|uniref:hypothetical protein n=1 Tax=Aliivibrio salmonicida TaxID=40269 RepID=UPI003D133F44
MASSCITFPARKGLSKELNDLAREWGYKQHGNGGYTGFISDILESVVENNLEEHPKFDLSKIVPKKPKVNMKR